MARRIDIRLGEFAREMRNVPTASERAIWRHLGGSRLDGLKFWRQSVIDGVIVDFHCPAIGLVVEIDGQTHDVDRDELRDAMLSERGLQVMRFTNAEVATNIDGVLRTIIHVAMQRRSTYFPTKGMGRQSGLTAGDVLHPTEAPTPGPSLEREGS